MNEKFIEASRDFVCIRIETYESKESEKMVRSLLNGRFANTAFCVFDPQGTRRLSRSGRGPKDLAGRRSSGGDNEIIREMNRIASSYQSRHSDEIVLQDFDTFRQALNVASADQRLLVYVTSKEESIKKNLQKVFSDKDVLGRYHVDFADAKTDKDWQEAITGEGKKPGVLIIRSGQFGTTGGVMKQLPESASAEDIKSALEESNKKFAAMEKRKVYSQHVRDGRRKGIFFENEIPYGEDRDADGKPDNRSGQRGQPRRRGGR